MKCEPEHQLLEQLRAAGIERRQLVRELGRPYGTISSWLRGFAPLPATERRKIYELINKKLQQTQCFNINSRKDIL